MNFDWTPNGKKTMKRTCFFLSLILSGIFSGGCARTYTAEQERIAWEMAEDRTFSERLLPTPARYEAEQKPIYHYYLNVIEGKERGNYENAVLRLSSWAEKIQRGVEWNIPRHQMVVPYLNAPPEIDGRINEKEWSNAEKITGEYEIDSPTPFVPGNGSCWFFGYDRNYFYVAGQFKEAEVISWHERIFEPGEAFYLGDCFEIFIRPQEKFLTYYEFLTNPAGDRWDMFHSHLTRGRWQMICEDYHFGIRRATVFQNGVLNYELAIPLKMLYGDWTKRGAAAGDRFDFMPVRINRDSEIFRRTTPVPLLYDGHNIFGYIQAVLGTKTE